MMANGPICLFVLAILIAFNTVERLTNKKVQNETKNLFKYQFSH